MRHPMSGITAAAVTVGAWRHAPLRGTRVAGNARPGQPGPLHGEMHTMLDIASCRMALYVACTHGRSPGRSCSSAGRWRHEQGYRNSSGTTIQISRFESSVVGQGAADSRQCGTAAPE